MKKIPAFNRNYGIEDYKEDTKLLDIRASVFIETDPIKNDFTKETKYVTELCEDPDNVTRIQSNFFLGGWGD